MSLAEEIALEFGPRMRGNLVSGGSLSRADLSDRRMLDRVFDEDI